MTKLQWAVNLFVLPFVLVAIGMFAAYWLAIDLFKSGACCASCSWLEEERRTHDSI